MIFIYAFYFYLVAGLIISIWFCFFKITKIDEAAVGTSYWFRFMIMPGVTLFWPLVIYKLSLAKNPPK